MGVKRKNKTWFGNFSYQHKYKHGAEDHFVGVKLLKSFTGIVQFNDEVSRFFEAKVGMNFEGCIYDPRSRQLAFYIDGDDDTPPVQTVKCNCCNEISSVVRPAKTEEASTRDGENVAMPS